MAGEDGGRGCKYCAGRVKKYYKKNFQSGEFCALNFGDEASRNAKTERCLSKNRYKKVENVGFHSFYRLSTLVNATLYAYQCAA